MTGKGHDSPGCVDVGGSIVGPVGDPYPVFVEAVDDLDVC